MLIWRESKSEQIKIISQGSTALQAGPKVGMYFESDENTGNSFIIFIFFLLWHLSLTAFLESCSLFLHPVFFLSLKPVFLPFFPPDISSFWPQSNLSSPETKASFSSSTASFPKPSFHYACFSFMHHYCLPSLKHAFLSSLPSYNLRYPSSLGHSHHYYFAAFLSLAPV